MIEIADLRDLRRVGGGVGGEPAEFRLLCFDVGEFRFYFLI